MISDRTSLRSRLNLYNHPMVRMNMVGIKDLKGKKVLITGGSSGIGLATAKLFSENGAEVLITARNTKKLKEASEKVEGMVSTYSADISDLDQVLKLSEKIEKEHKKIDILINSAGIVHPGKLEDLTFDQVNSIIDVDLKGTINTTKAFLPLVKSPGYIVNISSVAGFIGVYGYTAYSAAKFGVWGFSQSLRMELEPEDIGVSVVFPPDTDTPQLEFENRSKPEEMKQITGAIKPISPDKVATSILKAVKSGKFLVFPDSGSLSTYHAQRLAAPVVRTWTDSKVSKTRRN